MSEKEFNHDKDGDCVSVSLDTDNSTYPDIFLSIVRQRHANIIEHLENIREYDTENRMEDYIQSIENSLKIIYVFYQLTLEQLVKDEDVVSSGCCFGNPGLSAIDNTVN